MTATVYSQWQVSLPPVGRRSGAMPARPAMVAAGRRLGIRPVRRQGGAASSLAVTDHVVAMPVQWADASARGMGFSRARRAARWRRLALAAGDVCMVLVWAAMIPGLMWLGAVAGY